MKTIITSLLLFLSAFTALNAQTTISSFSPTSAHVGTLVTINGTNLSSPTSIIIGGISAIPITNTGTELVAMVMPGALTGAVSVGTVSGASNFTVTQSQTLNTQQGSKLVGTGSSSDARQGTSVAVSAAGNTAIVGGFYDNGQQGAAWVYVAAGAGAVLPVALLDFNARLNTNGTVQLNWSTASEANNNYFAVLRSTNGVSFTTIGKITAVGNSTQVQRYHFIDHSPLSGINYYKLVQYDIDGKKKDLGIRAVKISLTTNYLMVYPNPSKDAVHLRFAANIYQKLELVDITGKVRITRSVGKQASNITLNISSLAVRYVHY